MAKKTILKKKKDTLTKIEWIERAVEDALLLVMFLFTGLISIAVLGLLLFGQTTLMSRVAFVADTLAEHVIPWVIALSLLVIGREIWLIRIYIENIHIGMELEKMVSEIGKLEKEVSWEAKEIRKIEKQLSSRKKTKGKRVKKRKAKKKTTKRRRR